MENYGKKWTHDEIVLALGLYFQIPFGKIHSHSPEIIKLAGLMKRTPASLSMKMGNLGRLDPTLATREIGGLKNGAKIDKEVWDEFIGRRDDLATRYHELLLSLSGKDTIDDDVIIKTPQGLDRIGLSHYRINQSFFRQSVLSAYQYTCCITGLTEPKLLIASHVKPWAKCIDGNERTDTSNGLCLNALHDRAFDKGMITLDEQLKVVISPSLKDAIPHNVFIDYFLRYEGQQITLPHRGRPAETFLSYHRDNIFLG